jgi:hypothetical protein
MSSSFSAASAHLGDVGDREAKPDVRDVAVVELAGVHRQTSGFPPCTVEIDFIGVSGCFGVGATCAFTTSKTEKSYFSTKASSCGWHSKQA